MENRAPDPDGTSVELELRVSDPGLFFVRASRTADCRVALAEMVQRSDGRLLEYFTVEEAAPERVLAAADAAPEIDEARLIRDGDRRLLVEFVISGPCIGATLADAGAVVRSVEAIAGVGRVVADVPPHADPREVIDTAADRHETELVARRVRDRAAPEFTCGDFRATLAERLTDRQLEALSVAYTGGYFSWPRESTAEECAEALGISQPTFAQHLRVGQEKLFGAVFEEPEADGETNAVRTDVSSIPDA